MAKAKLIEDRDLERDYQIPNGRTITLVLDDFDYTITFKENNKKISGEFVFIDENVDDEGVGLAKVFCLHACILQSLNQVWVELR